MCTWYTLYHIYITKYNAKHNQKAWLDMQRESKCKLYFSLFSVLDRQIGSFFTRDNNHRTKFAYPLRVLIKSRHFYHWASCTALYRTQLPVHRKLIQWLLGPSPSLSATRDRSTVTGPDSKSVRTRSKFIQLTVVDDINAKAVEAWKQKRSI